MEEQFSPSINRIRNSIMFNPVAFSAPVTKSIVIANSAHPVMAHIKTHSFRVVPNMDYDLFYVELNEGRVVTYRKSDNSIQLLDMTPEEFRQGVKIGGSLVSAHEPITVQDIDKYLGNTLLEVLRWDAGIDC